MERTNVMQKAGKFTPKGIQGLNTGTKSSKSEQGINKNKARPAGGEMWKKPGKTGKGMASARSDESSSEVGPRKGDKSPGCDNERTYGGVEQPVQFSNAGGPKRTKFLW